MILSILKTKIAQFQHTKQITKNYQAVLYSETKSAKKVMHNFSQIRQNPYTAKTQLTHTFSEYSKKYYFTSPQCFNKKSHQPSTALNYYCRKHKYVSSPKGKKCLPIALKAKQAPNPRQA